MWGSKTAQLHSMLLHNHHHHIWRQTRPNALCAYCLASPAQGTYTDDGIFVSMGVFCSEGADYDFLSVLYAFSKDKLYSSPAEGETCEIYAATYLAPTAWHRSIPSKSKALIQEDHKPVNSYMLPARPQYSNDVEQPPLFVMQVRRSWLPQQVARSCYRQWQQLTYQCTPLNCNLNTYPLLLDLHLH